NCPGNAAACSFDALAPNGAACNDGNSCTQSDKCQQGVCVGFNPVTCTALDACHTAGTCDPRTGVCSNPSITGTVCLTGPTVLPCAKGSTASACITNIVKRAAAANRSNIPSMISDLQVIAAYPGLPEAMAADAQARINPSGYWNNIQVELGLLGTMKTAPRTQALKNVAHMTVPATGTCVTDDPGTGCELLEADYVVTIQAKAIEGLALLKTTEGDNEVLAAVANNANPTVQARAVLAYLFNHGATSAN